MAKVFNVGIYVRLSKEDNLDNESLSITNQKELLTKYAKENNLNIYTYYVDDGYSGTNFLRPSFNKMILDIKLGLINCVLVKDLSRLGRDYLKSGYYIDIFFKDNNIRFIALNDNIDTYNNDDDFLPFKNIINEMYAKDISKKINFTLANQMKNGVDNNPGIPTYGYKYITKNKRIIDEESAKNVLLIYNLYANGYSLSEIASFLKNNLVLTPSFYYYSLKQNLNNKLLASNPYSWNVETIKRILTNDAYIGILRRGKSKKNFKSTKRVIINKDDQFIFPFHHDSIISYELFYKVQELINKKETQKKNNYQNSYKGLIYCSICKKRMRHKEDIRLYSKNYIRLTCINKCGENKGIITYEELNNYLKNIMLNLKNILTNKDEFIDFILKSNKQLAKKSEIKKLESYLANLKREFANKHLLSDTYNLLVNEYHLKLEELNKNNDNDIYNLPILINLISKIDDNDLLNIDLIRKIVNKIYVRTINKQKKEIDIQFNYYSDYIKEFIHVK